MSQALLMSHGMGETVKHGRDLALLENDVGLVGSVFPIAYVCFLLSSHRTLIQVPRSPWRHRSVPSHGLCHLYLWKFLYQLFQRLDAASWLLDSERPDGHIRPSPCPLRCVPSYTCGCTHELIVCACTRVYTQASAYPSSGPERRLSLSASLFQSGIVP